MNYRLTRLNSSHENMRTDSMVGEIVALPAVGESFMIFGEPLKKGFDARVITTSPVEELWDEGNTIRFATRNSLYLLEAIEEN